MYGVPEELATDGTMVYMARETQEFLQTWGVCHRVSSSYFPHSNLRAETGVKSMKCLISQNTGAGGSLDTDRFTSAILQYWNTPDRDTGVSPAHVLFARNTVPVSKGSLQLRPEWVLTKDRREEGGSSSSSRSWMGLRGKVALA